MMTQEYFIVEGNDRLTVISNVNALLVQGWKLHGSTSMTTVVLGNNGVTKYSQALVREIEVPGAWG
jgi:hypothetical protein